MLRAGQEETTMTMNWTLEVVTVPVSDVDRAKAFYAEQLGFVVDHDTTDSDGMRFVQLTPRGSGCSVVLRKGVVDMAPGSLKGLQLVVRDVVAARAELAGRGVGISEVQVYARDGLRPMREGDDLNNVGFAHFSDPDGNGWAVQQITSRS
jgi:catechol 2,3-dioxygenase-like lactoylglutathione lyase family enzyme